jgi:hypothetical protein
MKSRHLLAVSAFALAASLAPAMAQSNSMPAGNGDRVDANGMPTTHSTPTEHAATADLNSTVSNSNVTADAQTSQSNAQYQQQQQQYQGALQQHQAAVEDHQAAVEANQAAQQQYQDQTAMYENLRARYAAERAAYHRGIWPSRYAQWMLEDRDNKLVGQRVEIINGDRVGTVTDVAHAAGGRVVGLHVVLDNNKLVWIDRDDIRYDRTDGIVMTNLDRNDLHQMADERL